MFLITTRHPEVRQPFYFAKDAADRLAWSDHVADAVLFDDEDAAEVCSAVFGDDTWTVTPVRDEALH